MPTAFKHGKAAKLYVNGYDLSRYMTKVGSAGKADVAEVSPLGTDDKEFLNGLVEGTMTGDGFYDDTVSAVAGVMGSAFAADTTILSHLPQGDSVGGPQKSMAAAVATFNIDTDTGDAGKITFEASSKTGAKGGVILRALATSVGTSGTSTPVNDVAAATNGSADGYLHVTDKSGAGNLVVKVQHSSDNISYIDLMTFATVTAKHQSERKSSTVLVPSGLVNKWLRVTFTLNTGTAKFFVALSRLVTPH
jgi:hypothetical protein